MQAIMVYAWLMFGVLCVSMLLALAVASTEKFGDKLLRDRRLYLKSVAATVPTFVAGYGIGHYWGMISIPETGLLCLINAASIAYIFQVRMLRAAKWCCAQLGWASLTIVACGVLYVIGAPIWRLLRH